MKKAILTILSATFAINVLLAQSAAVTNAILYHKDGEYDKAKTEINAACLHEKTSMKSKTWYYKGLIYESIATSDKFKASEPKAVETAYYAYEKALQVETSGEYYDMAKQRMDGIWGVLLNDGIAKYQAEKYKEAIANYELASKIKPKDTTAYVYGAYAAEADNDYKKAEEYYNKLKSLNFRNDGMYKTLAYIAKEVEKDNNKALAIIEEGRKYYPADKDLMIEELNIYITTGRSKEAMTKMQSAVDKDPKNKMLHYNLGVLQEQSGDKVNAEKSYMKALEVDANYFDALYNLGAMYYNTAAEKLSIANKMDFGTYQKEGKKVEDEAKGLFNKALPYFEKAHQIDPKNMETMESLKTIYVKVGRAEDSMKMLEKIQGGK